MEEETNDVQLMDTPIVTLSEAKELLGYTENKEVVRVDSTTLPGSGDNFVQYDENGDIRARRHLILDNNCELLGTTLSGSTLNLAQCSKYTDEGHPITDYGSASAHMTLNSYDRPNVQLYGESGNHLHQVAYYSEVTSLQTEVNEISEQVSQNTENITENTQDIQSLRDSFNAVELFRGYYQTTQQIEAIPSSKSGDYAWNKETGTVWLYDGTSWSDSTTPIPSDAIDASDDTPLVNGTASAGTSTEYSRGDHRHPTDETRASVVELDAANTAIENLQTEMADTRTRLSVVESQVTSNTNNIGTLQADVSSNASDVSLLMEDFRTLDNGLSDLQARTTAVEGDITALTTRITALENRLPVEFSVPYDNTVDVDIPVSDSGLAIRISKNGDNARFSVVATGDPVNVEAVYRTSLVDGSPESSQLTAGEINTTAQAVDETVYRRFNDESTIRIFTTTAKYVVKMMLGGGKAFGEYSKQSI